MQAITTIGLDIAKLVFQIQCIDAEGKVLIRRQLKGLYVLAFFQKLNPRCADYVGKSPEIEGKVHFDLSWAHGRIQSAGERG